MLSPDDRVLAAREPDLPGLAVLFDPAAFGQWLTSRGWLGDASGLIPLYARYKPRTSCVVLYAVNGSSAPSFLTATCHRSDHPEKTSKAQAKAAAWPLGSAFADPTLHLSALAFPFDPALPTLARLHTPASRVRTLRKVVADAHDLASPRDILRYKPERRLSQRWSVGDRSILLKAYAEPDYAQALASARAAHAAGLARPLVGQSERHRLLAWDWLEAEPLAAGDFARAGEALARVHASGAAFATHMSSERVVDLARASASAVVGLAPALADDINALLVRIAARLPSDGTACPIHGDCSPDQFLSTPAAATIIDFDNAAIGCPALDLGNFTGKCLATGVATGTSPIETRARASAFEDACRAASRHDARPWLPAFTSLALLRSATDPFRRRSRDWLSQLHAILSLARESIHDR